MKRFILSIGVILITFLSFSPSQTFAFEKASGSSAVLQRIETPKGPDNRAKILRKFLESYNSPLADSADSFVTVADQYGIDWRLVASISGVESTFARHLPYQSYNAWGWGIYGDNMIYFKSYEDGIAIISESLRTKYMDKWGAEDVYQIGRFYAADPNWAKKVSFFMNRIELFAAQNQVDTLSISL